MRRVLLCLGLVACAASDPAAQAWVDEVRAAHVAADGDASEAGDASLRAALASAPPEGVAAAAARARRQDTAYRLARRLLRRGDAAGAEAVADDALDLETMDVLTASLLVVRGEAREALGRAREAAADYHEALRVNERLLDRALAEEGR
ncbi:MAG: hypothetical protein AAGH15_26145 [Myxococcota bacterium]